MLTFRFRSLTTLRITGLITFRFRASAILRMRLNCDQLQKPDSFVHAISASGRDANCPSGLWPMEPMTPLRLSGTWIRHFWHRQRVTPSRTIGRPLTWQLAGNLHNEHIRIEHRPKTLMTQPTNREVAQRTCRNRERPLGHSTDNGLTSKCVRLHARVSASSDIVRDSTIPIYPRNPKGGRFSQSHFPNFLPIMTLIQVFSYPP